MTVHSIGNTQDTGQGLIMVINAASTGGMICRHANSPRAAMLRFALLYSLFSLQSFAHYRCKLKVKTDEELAFLSNECEGVRPTSLNELS